jgi:hypothetical protein
MNKKAIIMPETLKIIIAIACIVLLLVLGSQILSIFKEKTEGEQAKQTLNQIANKLTALMEKPDKTAESYTLISPKISSGKEFFVYYDVDIINKDSDQKMPSQCGGSYCLCLCNSDAYIKKAGESYWSTVPVFEDKINFYSGRFLDSCIKGICKNIPKIEFESYIPRRNFWVVGPFYDNLLIRKDWILFNNISQEIYFKKQGDKLSLIDASQHSIDFLNRLIDVTESKKEIFEDYLSLIYNQCNYQSTDSFPLTGDERSKIKEFMTNYKKDLPEGSRILSLMTGKGEAINNEYSIGDTFKDVSKNKYSRLEVIKICQKDFSLFLIVFK